MAACAIAAVHRRRLRELWRSAGWPCRDAIEIDLLSAGLLLRHLDGQGRETLQVSDAGVAVLAATRQRNRAAFDTHEALVARVAEQMQRAGRIVWRGLRLRSPLPMQPSLSTPMPHHAAAAASGEPLMSIDAAPSVMSPPRRWVTAMPDVYSIRQTTVEDYAEPISHEIKVRRADLLSDLRRPDKGGAYCAIASQCWYVLARGIADVDEVPAAYGVMIADAQGLEVARPAPRRALRLTFSMWMALARADAERGPEVDPQGGLVDAGRAPCSSDSAIASAHNRQPSQAAGAATEEPKP